MSKNVATVLESLLIEHLKAIRADIAHIKNDVHALNTRMASLEGHVVCVFGDVVRHSAQLDDLELRLRHVESQLTLSIVKED